MKVFLATWRLGVRHPPVIASRFYRTRSGSRFSRNDRVKFTSPHVDVDQRMQPNAVFYRRGHFPPKSNTERQRRFRKNHPGYYQRLHAKQRAQVQALAEAREAVEQAMARARHQLLLPAPVESIEIPGITTIGQLRAPVPEALPGSMSRNEMCDAA
jgi:hypothetical protein